MIRIATLSFACLILLGFGCKAPIQPLDNLDGFPLQDSEEIKGGMTYLFGIEGQESYQISMTADRSDSQLTTSNLIDVDITKIRTVEIDYGYSDAQTVENELVADAHSELHFSFERRGVTYIGVASHVRNKSARNDLDTIFENFFVQVFNATQQ